MKVLVTGSNGQLGRELHTALEAAYPGVTTYTDVTELDITDAKAVAEYIATGEFTHIINCAAYTAVDRAEADATLCYAINAEAVRNIASPASKSGAKVLHISTDYVFDGKSYKPYKEADRVNPLSVYGSSKRKGETTLLALCPDAIIVRTAWLYSPHGSNFVKTMLRLGKEKKQLRVIADQIGTPTSATDLAEAIVTIVTAPHWKPGIYNYSNEGVCSWYDFAKMIHRLAGITDCTVTPVSTGDYPTAATRPAVTVLDKSLIKNTYNITIPYWVDSLSMVIDRLLEPHD